MRYIILIVDIIIIVYAIMKLIKWTTNRRAKGKLLAKTPSQIFQMEQSQILPTLKLWLEGYYLNQKTSLEEQLEQMPIVERNIYTAIQFNDNVRSGGLYKYFVESSRYTIPYVTKALRAVGSHYILSDYKEFLQKDKVDLSDIHAFYNDYQNKKKRTLDKAYDYDFFNQRFKELHTIHRKSVTQIASYNNSDSATQTDLEAGIISSSRTSKQTRTTENLSQLIRDYAKEHLK
jgi:hypothetical protein